MTTAVATTTIAAPGPFDFTYTGGEYGWITLLGIVAVILLVRAESRVRCARRRAKAAAAASEIAPQRQIDLLTEENERLRGQSSRLEERVRVLERIATDPAARVSAEIDALR